MKNTLVVLDTETGGLDWRKHSIIEIAAWVVEIEKTNDRGLAFTYGDKFEAKCRPDRPVDLEAAKFNGYTEAGWADAPSISSTLRAFFAWLREKSPDGAMWCGSNPSFDLNFLESDAHRHSIAMPTHMSHRKCNITSLCFPLMITGVTPGIGLRHLRKWAGFDGEQAHRAMADVEETLAVFKKYLCDTLDAAPMAVIGEREECAFLAHQMGDSEIGNAISARTCTDGGVHDYPDDSGLCGVCGHPRLEIVK